MSHVAAAAPTGDSELMMTSSDDTRGSKARLTRPRLAVAAFAAMALSSVGTAAASVDDASTPPEIGTSDSPIGTHRWTSDYADACPPLSDSIDRLYTAYFQRLPDAAGWSYWSGRYAQYEAGLPTMSQAFADSDEFKATYGALDNAAFVELVYRNVMGREPDAAGFAHWVASLDSGYPRGSVMIAFSESKEFVELTGTVPPLAGYLQWYAEPVRYTCGYGDEIATPYTPFQYADFLIVNASTTPAPWSWSLRNSHSGGDITTEEEPLPGESYMIYWNIPADEVLPGTWGVVFDTGNRDDVGWMLVTHGSLALETRHPWDELAE